MLQHLPSPPGLLGAPGTSTLCRAQRLGNAGVYNPSSQQQGVEGTVGNRETRWHGDLLEWGSKLLLGPQE